MIQFFERNWNNLLLSAMVLGAAIAISLIAHYKTNSVRESAEDMR